MGWREGCSVPVTTNCISYSRKIGETLNQFFYYSSSFIHAEETVNWKLTFFRRFVLKSGKLSMKSEAG